MQESLWFSLFNLIYLKYYVVIYVGIYSKNEYTENKHKETSKFFVIEQNKWQR